MISLSELSDGAGGSQPPPDISQLRARVLDPTLDREQRLLAFWILSARHWRQRTTRAMYAEPHDDDENDKIIRAKRASSRRVAVREKARRIANGSKRVRRVVGTMAAIETPDAFCNHICEHCDTPFTPNKPYLGKGRAPMYCSHGCRQAAYRARKAAA